MKSLKKINLLYYAYIDWSEDYKNKYFFSVFFGLYSAIGSYRIIQFIFPNKEVSDYEVIILVIGFSGMILANAFMYLYEKKMDKQKYLRYIKSLKEGDLRVIPLKVFSLYMFILIILFFS